MKQESGTALCASPSGGTGGVHFLHERVLDSAQAVLGPPDPPEALPLDSAAFEKAGETFIRASRRMSEDHQ